MAAYLFAEFALPLPLSDTFHYIVPDPLAAEARVGRLARVPFGKKEFTGLCVALEESEQAPTRRQIRPILHWLAPDFALPAELIRLGLWIADYYFCGPGEALAAVSFLGFNPPPEKKIRCVALAPQWRSPTGSETEESLARRAPARRLLEALRAAPEWKIPTSELLKRARAPRPALEALLGAGAAIEEEILFAPSFSGQKDTINYPLETPLVLTAEQQGAFDAIAQALDARRFETFLLQGVTGSGKTEIYLQAIERCLRQGREAICLVPEIALTPQTIERFRARFGPLAGVCHGRMSRPEKLRLAREIAAGRVRIVVGPRSAVFSPVPRLGLLIVDEEHESSYKQQETPRYHARDTGLMRAREAGAAVVLGSATPSLESLANAERGKYRLLRLTGRPTGAPLPRVEIVDMGEELRERRNPGLFSRRLENAIRERLERREQVLLFLNRRGFANFLYCPACRYIHRCRRDDFTLTLHRIAKSRPAAASDPEESDLFPALWTPRPESRLLKTSRAAQDPDGTDPSECASAEEKGKRGGFGHFYLRDSANNDPGGNPPQEAPQAPRDAQEKPAAEAAPGEAALICHFCGHRSPPPPRCPQCGAEELAVIGQGTQRVEEEIHARFPDAACLRMDLDTMSGKRAYDDAWERIARGNVDIILGTQIIAKGLHLERVTLVGVTLADVGLYVPDFRASERTFSLLTQVAGRAGRGGQPGEVIIQTYTPNAPAVECALEHDVERFARAEMKRRRWLRFPPVQRLAALTLSAGGLGALIETAETLAGILRRLANQPECQGATVLGPMPAPFARLRDRWRQRILIRAPQPPPLHALLRSGLAEFRAAPRPPAMRLTVDVDPMDLM